MNRLATPGIPATPETLATGRLRLTVPDMDCPSCLATICDRLEKVPGVVDIQGSPVRRELDITYQSGVAEPATLKRAVERLGYATRPRGGSAAEPDTWTGPQARIAYASAGLFAVAGLLHLAGISPRVATTPWRDFFLPDLVFVVSALVGGWNFFPKGVRAARALALDMNFLMTVAILGAVGIGEYAEGAAIAFLFAVAELLERYAVDRARASVEALMRLAPATARLLRDGVEVEVEVDALAPGELVAVRPGDRVPTDGTVVEGHSAVDESAVTGESMPVEKPVGATVYAGTINREGYLAVRVDRRAADSTLARIIRMVEEAESRKTRTERFIERFARVYTPAVTVAAVLTVLVPVAVLGGDFATWLVRGLTLLVIACPCALVISTPVAVVSGITAAARNGVLIKGGSYLEAMGQVRVVALDKTGTVTFGRPVVVDTVWGPSGPDPEQLRWIRAVESRSEHPIARAVADALRDTDRHTADAGAGAPPVIAGFAAVPGRGVRADVEGRAVLVGRPDFAAPGVPTPAEWADTSGSVVVATIDGTPVAWFRVADRTRGSAADVVTRLRAQGIERIVMLTGDSERTAQEVGRALGVDEVFAGLLPQDKVAAVEALTRAHGPVAMVGDGVNDAPALATAGIGIVMGAAGSDAALETADVALMGDDLSRLPYLRTLSREGVRVIRTNIALALGVKAVLALGVPLGAVSLITAVLVGDMGVSLAVTVNALRLARVGAAQG